MSKFPAIEADFRDPPRHLIGAEAATFASVTIWAGSTIITRVVNEATQEERESIYVPAIAIAEWVADNWWALLNEPSRTEHVSMADVLSLPEHLSWTKRHCLRTADAALLLPSLYVFSDGSKLVAAWHADSEGSLPHMRGRFIEDGRIYVDPEAASRGLAEFVEIVLERVADQLDERAQDLRDQWAAIKKAEPQEVNFCTVAGRMGLNPYDQDDLPESTAELIDSIADRAHVPLIRDLTEATTTELFGEDAAWVQAEVENARLTAIPSGVAASLTNPQRSGFSKPFEYGYAVAAWARRTADLGSDPISSLLSVAHTLTQREVVPQLRSGSARRDIRGIVGWAENETLRVTDRGVTSDRRSRFLVARGIFHGICSCDSSARLMTEAHTWDQRAARSFAAELLAPRKELASRSGASTEADCIDDLSREFDVDPFVIEHQLENAGVSISYS